MSLLITSPVGGSKPPSPEGNIQPSTIMPAENGPGATSELMTSFMEGSPVPAEFSRLPAAAERVVGAAVEDQWIPWSVHSVGDPRDDDRVIARFMLLLDLTVEVSVAPLISGIPLSPISQSELPAKWSCAGRANALETCDGYAAPAAPAAPPELVKVRLPPVRRSRPRLTRAGLWSSWSCVAPAGWCGACKQR